MVLIAACWVLVYVNQTSNIKNCHKAASLEEVPINVKHFIGFFGDSVAVQW
jgi:hypothetical protein